MFAKNGSAIYSYTKEVINLSKHVAKEVLFQCISPSTNLFFISVERI